MGIFPGVPYHICKTRVKVSYVSDHWEKVGFLARGTFLRPPEAPGIFLMCWGHREVDDGLKYMLCAVFECF